ncbi:MAG: VanZ family protein [Planctomycetaceae bacterium]|jgi:VanZ family protein|nr:VanZ family protein [Planctomycetaceae bacterium]
MFICYFFLLRYVAVAYWILLTVLLLVANPLPGSVVDEAIDYKHLLSFGFLGMIVLVGLSGWERRLSVPITFVGRWTVILILYGFLTEVAQIFVPVRTFELGDVFQDAIGVVCGTGIGYAIIIFLRRMVWKKLL